MFHHHTSDAGPSVEYSSMRERSRPDLPDFQCTNREKRFPEAYNPRSNIQTHHEERWPLSPGTKGQIQGGDVPNENIRLEGSGNHLPSLCSDIPVTTSAYSTVWGDQESRAHQESSSQQPRTPTDSFEVIPTDSTMPTVMGAETFHGPGNGSGHILTPAQKSCVPTDAGYESTLPPKLPRETVDRILEPASLISICGKSEGNSQAVVSTAASVVPDVVRQCIFDICKDIYNKTSRNSQRQTWTWVSDNVAALVRAFAIKLGSCHSASTEQWRIMCFVYKHHL